MSGDPIPVTIRILDKEYMVSCPPEEKEGLIESARLLNARMRQVRDSGKVMGAERMAVMTALNVIHEFSRDNRAREVALSEAGSAVGRLEQKVREAIPRRTSVEPVD